MIDIMIWTRHFKQKYIPTVYLHMYWSKWRCLQCWSGWSVFVVIVKVTLTSILRFLSRILQLFQSGFLSILRALGFYYHLEKCDLYKLKSVFEFIPFKCLIFFPFREVGKQGERLSVFTLKTSLWDITIYFQINI